MDNKRDYIEAIARMTAELSTQTWNDPHHLFTPTLEAMTRDAQRWLDTEWKAPNGNTTPIERAIVVLTQDMIVLLGHAHNNEINHPQLDELRSLAQQAVENSIIEDNAHREHFSTTSQAEGKTSD